METSTTAGPDGGNLARAWSVNAILANAGINPNLVTSVEGDLQGGRGTAIDPKGAKPSDVVIMNDGNYIGIFMGDGKVANNSSSRAAFVNMSDMTAGMRVHRMTA